MAKRTYSRRNMTKMPDEHDSPPDDSFKRKRRKSDVKNGSSSHSGAVPSPPPPRRPSHAMPKSKKFSGPVSLPDEEMDWDESPRGCDVSSGALKMPRAKAGFDKGAQSGGSLHGGREGFNKLIAAKKTDTKATAFTKDRQSHEGQGSYGSNGNRNLANGNAKASKHATGTANVRNNEQSQISHALTDLADSLLKAKLVLKEKAYKSTKMEPHSKDLLGRRTQEDSKARWMENQSNSPFLRLPEEVRNRIYEFALGGKTIIIDYVTYDTLEIEGQLQMAVPIFKYRYEVHEKRHNPFQQYMPDDLEFSTSFTFLNQVCRQLYLETAILPYKLNAWAFTSHNIMWNFLGMERRFTRQQCNAITELTVTWSLPDQNLLALLGNLERVRLAYGESWLRGWYRVDRRSAVPALVRAYNWKS